jgi:hypothetical protein
MEIIIAVLVFGVALWWFFIRDEKKPVVEDAPSAPYKVPEPAPTTPIPLVVEEPVVAVVAEKAPAKPKPAARTAKPKAPAKAPVKAKAPAKPRATKAKPQA